MEAILLFTSGAFVVFLNMKAWEYNSTPEKHTGTGVETDLNTGVTSMQNMRTVRTF